ncbi:hypothetical protein DSECCO2_592720 [anaerobic digester metagenome]
MQASTVTDAFVVPDTLPEVSVEVAEPPVVLFSGLIFPESVLKLTGIPSGT